MIAASLVHDLANIVDLTRTDMSAELVYSRVVEAAERSVPGCDGASFVLWPGGPPRVHIVTHPDLAHVDESQFQVREGPGLAALRQGTLTELPDTLRDRTWPTYSVTAIHHGVRCCVATTFPLHEGRGLLQLYATEPRRLSRELDPALALIATQTRAAIRNVTMYAQVQANADQMRAARESSTVIEEAKGILMCAYRCDADAAFDRLRMLSQRRQVKLATVAERLVRQVASGARGLE
jgi:GAF domain-containing protein